MDKLDDGINDNGDASINIFQNKKNSERIQMPRYVFFKYHRDKGGIWYYDTHHICQFIFPSSKMSIQICNKNGFVTNQNCKLDKRRI